MTRCANTGLHLLTGRSMIAPVDNAESRLASRERHVVGNDRLGETLQDKRAKLFSRYASSECHVDALTEQNLADLASPQSRAATLHTVPIAVYPERSEKP